MSELQYYEEGIEGRLECHDLGCEFSAWLPLERFGGQAVLELLWQPRDARGLVDGPASVVFRGVAPVVATRDPGRGRARWRIEGVRPELANACHVRILPEKIH